MINTAHPVDPEEVMAYLDGELAPARAVTVATHVDGCVECRGLVRDLQAVSQRMTEWEVGACGLVQVGERPAVRRWRKWKWAMCAAGVWVMGVAVLVVMTVRRPALNVEPGAIYNSESNYVFIPEGQTKRSDFGTRLKSEFSTPVMIARTAELVITSTDFTHARERLEAILKSHHGYMGELTMSAPAGAGRTLGASLKVPSGELDASMAELRKLGRIESESQSGEEVTQQYVDLEARLANARNAEQRLSAVLKQAGKMADVLAVEKEITRVRGEIETMDAERKALSKRVEFATINVKITEQYKAQLRAPDSIGMRLSNAAVAGYRHIADGAMGLAEFGLEYGLSLAIWLAVLFWPARWAWRRYRAG